MYRLDQAPRGTRLQVPLALMGVQGRGNGLAWNALSSLAPLRIRLIALVIPIRPTVAVTPPWDI